jgi:bacterioferritin (cytochrome b1)
VDFLETQLEVISKIGIENYLTQQIELEGGK